MFAYFQRAFKKTTFRETVVFRGSFLSPYGLLILAEVKRGVSINCPNDWSPRLLSSNDRKWTERNFPHLTHSQNVFLCPSHPPVEQISYNYEGERRWAFKIDPDIMHDDDSFTTYALCFAVLQKRTFTLMSQTLAHYRKVIPGARTYAYVTEFVPNPARVYGLDNDTTQVLWKQILPSGYRQDTSISYAIRQQGQYLAYNDFLNRFRHRHDWMLFVDADDWLIAPYSALKAVSRERNCAVHIPWHFYNVSKTDKNHVRFEDAFEITKTRNVKNMANTQHALSVGIHNTDECCPNTRKYRTKDMFVAHMRFPSDPATLPPNTPVGTMVLAP